MKKTKTTARADEADVPVIDGAKPSRKNVNGKQIAFVTFVGVTPEDGAQITFTAINGVTYTATVASAIEVDGKITCELSDGPHVAKK